MIHQPFLRSAILAVGDFRIGDFDLQSSICGFQTKTSESESGPAELQFSLETVGSFC